MLLVNTAVKADALEDAFNAFCRKSSLLESAYGELQEEVSILNAQLQHARRVENQQHAVKNLLSNRIVHILEMLPGAVLIIDAEGTICECNSRAEELLQLPLLGCAWSVIVKREFCRAASKDGELKLRNGQWLSLARRSLGIEPGEVLLLTDITESRRTADLLQRSERLSTLGEMSACLGHQIRTPLSAALLYASELKEIGTAEQIQAAKQVVARLQDLSATVNDILAFAKGTQPPGECVNVEELFNDVDCLAQSQLQGRGRIVVEVAEQDMQVFANREAIKGALLNLVTNAIQAGHEDVVVELSAVRLRTQICLTVTDNGPGIRKDIRARLFDPFFTTRPQGTGLGLAVVKSVAEGHNGDVVVDCGPHGTAFTICIPEKSSNPHSVLSTPPVTNDE